MNTDLLKFTKGVYLLLGGNVGNRTQQLKEACRQIELLAGKIIAASAVHETAPWGNPNQPNFFNQAVEIETNLSPYELLNTINKIEENMGRVRKEKWGPRTIDIDIIFYGNNIIDTPELKIPHPFMHERSFVLLPLSEIAGNFFHPIINNTVQEILENLNSDK